MPDQDPNRPDDSHPAERPLFALPAYGDDDFDEPPLQVILVPARPHPSGFGWALLWCIGYLIVTQIPAVMIFLVVFLMIVPGGIAQLQNQDAAVKTPEYAQAMAPALLVAQILGVIGSLIALRVIAGKEWPRKVALRLPSWPHVVLALLGFPGMYLLAAGVDIVAKEIFQYLFERDSLFSLDEMVELFGQWPLYFAILAVAFGPGFAEELFCRGFLGRGLVGNYGVVAGVLLTSFFFGLLHIEPRQVAYAFLIGVLLHGAYLATRSLWIPIMLHVVNNGFSIAALHLPPELRDLGEAQQQIPVYIFVGAGVLVLAVGWALYASRARLISTSPEALPWQPDFPGVEYPPPGSETMVYRPMPTPLNWTVALAGVLFFATTITFASR